MMASLVPAAIIGLFDRPIFGVIPTLIDAALRSLLVAVAVWAGLRLLRTRNVVAQKAAWGLVLAGALLMPLVVPWAARLSWLPAKATLVLPAHPWLRMLSVRSQAPAAVAQITSASDPKPAADAVLVPAEATAMASDAGISPESMTPAPDRFPAPAISDSPSPKASSTRQTPSETRSRLLSGYLMAWLLYCAVSVALLFRLLYGLGAAVSLWLGAEPVAIESAPHLMPGLHVRSSRDLSSPVTVGSGIVLPCDYTDWDAEKLRIVLAHERSHVRQGDFYLQLCGGLYASLFWFSPLGWWLKRKLSDLSEAISDRAGLLEAASHASYAQVLLEFAALPRTALTSRIPIGVAMARPGRLTHRIERLLNESSFRQAFAGGRSRMLAALVLIPAYCSQPRHSFAWRLRDRRPSHRSQPSHPPQPSHLSPGNLSLRVPPFRPRLLPRLRPLRPHRQTRPLWLCRPSRQAPTTNLSNLTKPIH
jgi:beta-lactamase regulating signal transducer with metallopeptidase domain